jgi:hypothetical protein
VRERWEKILRIFCLVLAGLLVYRVAMVIKHGPLTGLTIPQVPALIDTNAVASAKGTNGPSPSAANKGTNATNIVIAANSGKNGTNGGTNQLVAKAGTNSPASGKPIVATTNLAIAAKPGDTNLSTNMAAANGTNGSALKGTNGVAAAGGKRGTNGPPQVVAGNFPPGFPGGPGMRGGPSQLPELPPLIQGRVNKIIVSEIFAPMMHPMPAELMGVAGNYAFLRSSKGQTGMVKEGDSLGGLKLLEVGINRVLIEEDGEKKELMIFSGFGSETLMPKPKENTNDIARKSP